MATGQFPDRDAVTPRRFAYDEAARALLVEWLDGSGQSLPFADLRRACPCAGCRGELGRPGRFESDPKLHPGEDELADIELVGSYGLKAIWADGHDTGIYRFELLRQIGELTDPSRS
ncbi:MAG: gamma-butyrobetaine hydroxylase-like domain-containing protein [Candidatus Dormibacteria bacterium]